MGSLTYADDLTLLAPSPTALRKLLYICKQFGAANMLCLIHIKLNASNIHIVVPMVLVAFSFVASQFLVPSLLM